MFDHSANITVVSADTHCRTGSYLDDQPGEFPCTGLAYGPYEAIQLLARDGALALLNIENYVWYALVSLPQSCARSCESQGTNMWQENYWGNECGGTFTAPENNDIPAVCKQGFKGAVSNIWCWES